MTDDGRTERAPDGHDDPSDRGGAVRQGGIARHGRLRRGHPVAFAAKVTAAALAVVLVSTTSIAAIATWQVLQGARPTVQLAGPDGSSASPVPQLTAQTGEVNLLLIGTDTREGLGTGFDDAANQQASSGAGKNDSTVLVHISEDHTNMAVVSFPRDLIVPMPACPNDDGTVSPATSGAMLNTALGRGGPKNGLSCVAQTIGQLTGLQIDYAGSITFEGVVSMADAIGGVEVCLATPIRDTEVQPALDLPAGTRTLSGAEAGAFLRSRYGVGDSSDLGRISNQQTFLSALARQTVSAGTLTDPTKVLAIARVAFANMTLSDTLADASTLAKLALAVNTVGLSNMVFVQYPAVDDPADRNRVLVDESAAAVLDDALQRNLPLTLSADSLGRSAVLDPAAPAAPGVSASPSTGAGGEPSGEATDGAVDVVPGAGATPAPTPAPTSAALPGNVSGQSADQVTCAKRD